MSVTAELHAVLLSIAVLGALLFSGIILARNPRSTPARLHAIYGGLGAGWLYCMAMIASADTPAQVNFWARWLQVDLGLLPGVIFHLNVATAGLAHLHQRAIRGFYAVSVCAAIAGIANPALFSAPVIYSWGYYPAYTLWGLLPPALIGLAFISVVVIYRRALRTSHPKTAYHQKLKAFYHGNSIAAIALIDFLPAFGVAVYPFGYAIITLMHVATVFGTVRYRLIELTPEFAAGQILQAIPEGVLVIDSQGLIRLVNEAAAQMFGRSRAQCLHQSVADVAPKVLADTLQQPLLAQHTEISFSSAENQRHWTVGVSCNELSDQEKATIGNVWVLHDLTDRRRMEAEKTELEGWVRSGQKLGALGVMAGGIAHDFNNILGAIIGSADLARQQSSDPGLLEELDSIINSSEVAVELTNQMLTYAGQNSMGSRPLDVNALCHEVGELLQSAVSKKATFVTRFADALPLVEADSGQLTQVVLNLVANASDALGDQVGTVTLRTGTLEMQREDTGELAQHIFIEVSDTGSGMDADTQANIFDPFFTTKFAGRGLGLANVMSIVQAHKGRIKVDSSPGEGSRFTVAIPSTGEVPQARPALADDTTLTGQGFVLVVDDEPEIRRVAAKMLSRLGFKPIEAANGKEAIACLEQQAQDIALVLLDITMPEMDGIATHRAIRAMPAHASLPVLLTSGYQASAVPQPSFDPQTTFLSKPFRFAQLKHQIHLMLGSEESAGVND